MKYLLLSYTPITEWDSSEPDTPSEDALEAFAIYEKFQAELMASGELVAAEGLGHPSMSRTLRKQADAVVVSDGPFAELKEVLASYAVIDCSGYDRAVERLPGRWLRRSVTRLRSDPSWVRTSASPLPRLSSRQANDGHRTRARAPVAHRGAAGARRVGAPIRPLRHR